MSSGFPDPFVAWSIAAILSVLISAAAVDGAGSWCIARGVASATALQTALDYACGAGADCTPIQPSGLCYLPNTLQAHASYAFNSYYQRSNYAPGSCEFAGTATITVSDPSYGSCTYPASPSSAGAVMTSPNSPKAPINAPGNVPGTFPIGGGSGVSTSGGFPPALGSSTTDASANSVSLLFSLPMMVFAGLTWVFSVL